MSARLDEKSARRIAAGRLKLLKEQIDSARPRPTRKEKPNARAKGIEANLRRRFGSWLFFVAHRGRHVLAAYANPSEQSGWIDLFLLDHNLRSDAVHICLIAQFSAHAVARLLERRRDVDVERLFVEELEGAPLLELLDKSSSATQEFRIATKFGSFRFEASNGEPAVAVTWVQRKPFVQRELAIDRHSAEADTKLPEVPGADGKKAKT
jgi:hypothetical protein